MSRAWLRRRAAGWSLRHSSTVADALRWLEFVQADPIRAPAPAQDLILRHRVARYRAGDLDRAYPHLPADEDTLYAYGFVARRLRGVLHPRTDPEAPDGRYAPTGLDAEVLAFVREHGVTHPRAVQAALGRSSVVNGWGGRSAATTDALERLHRFGLVRVARRERGVRLYEQAPPLPEPLPVAERAGAIALRIAATLAPVPEPSLRAALPGRVTRAAGGRQAVVRRLLDTGALAATEVEGVRYVWPADAPVVPDEPGERVRFLAPFDPLVWDRRRFEHLWGWAYRFEAYTPVRQRRLGYYALPLLWRDHVVGWVTCSGAGPKVRVEAGFVAGAPRQRRFTAAFDAEVDRLRRFLTPRR